MLSQIPLRAVPVFVAALVFTVTARSEPDSHESQFTTNDLLKHPSTSWLTNGGNLFNQRFSPLTEISTENVAGLKGVWHVHLNGSGVGPPFSGEAQPIVHDGLMYVVTGANDVFAIDIGTGSFAWTYESGLDPAIATVCCGWTSRGVAIGQDKLFLSRLDNKLTALDLKSGKVLWSVDTASWEDGYTITSAPLFYDGMVITGYAGAEYGVRGRIRAFSADDGSLLWTFHTIPGPGELGHETWPSDTDAWKNGGGTVWHTPAVDPELGLLYFATGNAGPDFNGSMRKGDNLFTSSIVALDVKTGAYRWHFQEVHHDLWDYDAANPVILFDAEIRGEPRKGLAHAGKTGWVYILDRTNGEPLIGIEERPVPQEPRQHTAATQPFPVGDAFVPQKLDMPLYGYQPVNEGRIFTPFWQDFVAITPSAFGAAQWAPSSLDPRTNTMYVCAMDLIGIFTGGADAEKEAGKQFLGGQFIFDKHRTGIFAALDVTTNKLRWQQRWEDSCYSGSTVTAGNLVFTGKNDGRFVALDARDGSALWSFQTGAGVNAPPVVFEFKGREHVAVYAAGALFAQSPPGDSVWLFALDGELGEVESRAPMTEAERLFAERAAANGEPDYVRYCGSCHGADGTGGHGGGSDLTKPLDPAHISAVIINGKGAMPAFADTLDPTRIGNIVQFVMRRLRAGN